MKDPVFVHTKISPSGHLRLFKAPDGSEGAELLEIDLLEVFGKSFAAGIFELVLLKLNRDSSPILSHWQDLGRQFLEEVCSLSNIDETRSCSSLTTPMEWLQSFYENLPPQQGLGSLSIDALVRVWEELKDHFNQLLQSSSESSQSLLRSFNVSRHLSGRVYFHLAENKKDPDKPFAFMASYTTRLNHDGKAQHLPLAKAIENFAAADKKEALISLLDPIQKAGETIPWVKALSGSSAIFHPQAWAAEEALSFLKSVPDLESQGIIVRIPDWWASRKKKGQAKLHVTLGKRSEGSLGSEALLDFDLGLSLGDEILTERDLGQLLRYTEGLTLFRGKWVEINHRQLKDVLDNWRTLTKRVGDEGLPFHEALRLLAGVDGLGGTRLIEGKDAEASVRVSSDSWLKEILEGNRSPQIVPELPEIGLRAALRDYQRHGVNWLWTMNRLRLGACLADDMGLGKTMQILSLLLIKQKEQPGHRSLLVVPTSLISNWQNEADRFAPGLRLKILHGLGKNANVEAEIKDSSFDLAITSYAMALRMEELQHESWDLLILDEAQAIKNPDARQTRALKSLKANQRIVLTGTPVENGVGDLWSIFDFLTPGLLGRAEEFKTYLKRADGEKRAPYAGIKKLVRPYILRRLKTDKSVISDLPDKTEITSFCHLSRTQAVLYQESITDLAEKLPLSEGIQRRGVVLAFLMRFKQICNHPSQWTQDGLFQETDSGKFKRLREICSDIALRQEKLLVFTQFREMTLPLADFLTRIFGEPGFILHGGTSVKSRKQMMEKFQVEDGPPFFILSLKAGGTGLNLTAASHVIHFDRWWNPAVENQATDRAFRIGQKKNVLVHKFVCKGTLEERINRLLQDKQAVSQEILTDGDSTILTEMSNSELLDLVKLDLNSALE